MVVKHLWAALLGAALLLAGCRLNVFDHTAENIAAIRKSGNLNRAREKALEVLQQKPGKLDVWRELASTDVQISRRLTEAVEAEQDPLPALVEAALICAAYNDFKQGQPDREWMAVGLVVASEVGNRANYLAGQWDGEDLGRYTAEPPDRSLEPMEHEYGDEPLVLPRHNSPEENPHRVDAETLGETLRQAVALTELLRHLPWENPNVMAVTLNQLDRKLAWVALRSDISTAFVALHREAARKAVTDALQAAGEDLASVGHFDPAQIQNNGILK